MEEALASLRATVDGLCAAELASLEDTALRELALTAERLAHRLHALASTALGEVHDRTPDGTATWWRDELGISGVTAAHAVHRAHDLRQLPVVGAAALSGELTLDQAGALRPLLGKLDDALLRDSQRQLVDGARGRTTDAISRWVRYLIALNNEPALDDEQAAAHEARFLSYRTGSDGLVRGRFALPTDAFEGVSSVLEPLARRDGATDTRTAAQRRADALVDVFAAAARFQDLPEAGGQRAQVSYVLAAEWAARQEWAPPATGAWMGPASRAQVEAVLCDARLSRVLLDDNGQAVSLESVRGDITLAQRRAVSARDRCCVARGCARPPAFCDVHHLRARADGGPTSVENLVLLCRRHHVMWHKGAVQLADLDVPWLRKPLDPPMVA